MGASQEAAIYQGAYGSPSNGGSRLFQCETGNCSFAHHGDIAYQTLGICHKCANVSSHIITLCQNGTYVAGYYSQECNYTLPLQPNVTSLYVRKTNESHTYWPATQMNDSTRLGPSLSLGQYWQGGHVLSMQAENTREQLYADPFSSQSSPDLVHPNPGIALVDTNSIGKFANLAEVYYANETKANAYDPINNYPIGVECGLYPCIQSYGAAVKNNLLIETLIHQQYLHWPNIPFVDLAAAASPCVIDGKLIDTSAIKMFYNITVDALGVETGSTPIITGVTDENSKCLYHLGRSSISALMWFFVGTFNGDFYENVAYTVSGTSPAWLSMISKMGAGNLAATNRTMLNMATSITNQMRLRASNSKPAEGQVWWSEICVEVQWRWLTLHAILVCFCFAFLILTMLSSSRYAKGKLWKSSPLALVFHGLDQSTTEKIGAIGVMEDMEDRARTIRVHWAQVDQGWKLVEPPG